MTQRMNEADLMELERRMQPGGAMLISEMSRLVGPLRMLLDDFRELSEENAVLQSQLDTISGTLADAPGGTPTLPSEGWSVALLQVTALIAERDDLAEAAQKVVEIAWSDEHYKPEWTPAIEALHAATARFEAAKAVRAAEAGDDHPFAVQPMEKTFHEGVCIGTSERPPLVLEDAGAAQIEEPWAWAVVDPHWRLQLDDRIDMLVFPTLLQAQDALDEAEEHERRPGVQGEAEIVPLFPAAGRYREPKT